MSSHMGGRGVYRLKGEGVPSQNGDGVSSQRGVVTRGRVTVWCDCCGVYSGRETNSNNSIVKDSNYFSVHIIISKRSDNV